MYCLSKLKFIPFCQFIQLSESTGISISKQMLLQLIHPFIVTLNGGPRKISWNKVVCSSRRTAQNVLKLDPPFREGDGDEQPWQFKRLQHRIDIELRSVKEGLPCANKCRHAAGESLINDVPIPKQALLEKIKVIRKIVSSIGAIDLKQPRTVLMNTLLFNLQILPTYPIPIISVMTDDIVEFKPRVIQHCMHPSLSYNSLSLTTKASVFIYKGVPYFKLNGSGVTC